MDPGISEGNADTAHGVRSHEGGWTREGRGDFAAVTRVLLLVSHGGSRNRVRQAMSTLHGLESGGESPATTGRDGTSDETWRGVAFSLLVRRRQRSPGKGWTR